MSVVGPRRLGLIHLVRNVLNSEFVARIRLSARDFLEDLKELLPGTTGSPVSKILLGEQSRDLLSEGSGHELIDGDALSLCQLPDFLM